MPWLELEHQVALIPGYRTVLGDEHVEGANPHHRKAERKSEN
jgi:hypothetical protein